MSINIVGSFFIGNKNMVLYIRGTDSFRCTQKYKELKNNYFEKVDPSGINFTLFDVENFKLDVFLNTAQSLPFLVKRRMIVVKNILTKGKNKDSFDKVSQILDDLEKSENVIIFWEDKKEKLKKRKVKGKKEKGKKGLEKNLLRLKSVKKYPYQFDLPDGAALNSWINNQVQSKGMKIDFSACQLLGVVCGSDLWKLSGEINKLISYLYSENRNNIEIKDINLLTQAKENSTIYELVDAIGNQKKTEALMLLEDLFGQGIGFMEIQAMLSAQFRNLLVARDWDIKKKNPVDLAKALKLPPFVANKIFNQSQMFSYDRLSKIYVSLLGLDKRLKSGGESLRILYDLLIYCI